MISHPVLSSVLTASKQNVASGYRIDAVPGTPLHTLCMRSTNMSVDTTPTPEGIVEASSVPVSAEVGSAHDFAMNDITDQVARIMRGGLDLIRNEVLPLVKELHEKYTVTLDGLVTDTATPVGVLPNIYHKIWGVPMLRDMVARFENVPLNAQKWPHAMPELTGADIRPMLNTGVSQVDDVIEQWVDDMPADMLVDAYNAVFVHKHVAVGKRTNAHHVIDGTQYNRNVNLVAFLIAQGMERNLPDGVSVNIDVLRTSLAKLQSQAGRAVVGEITRRRQDSNNGVLVFKVETKAVGRDFTKRVVHVNNDVYVDYLERNGTVEALYGAVLANKPMTVSALIDNKDEYEAVWAKYSGLHQQKMAALKFAYQKEALSLTITRYVNSLDDDALPAPRDLLHKLAVDCINGYKPADMVDSVLAVRKVVCCVLYADTNAEMFVNAMDQAEIDNPDFSPRECALFAAIETYAQWAASQLVKHKL